MKKQIVAVFAVLVLLALACSNTPTALPSTVSQNQAASPTSIPPTETSIPSETAIPAITYTPKPTNTLLPTKTPKPTNTPKPTSTSTPTPAPVVLTGTGDTVVDVNWTGAGLLHITYTGESNFAIINYDSYGNRMDLLVNTIGSYEGTLPFDLMQDEDTTRFEIKASGSWEIQILPLDNVRVETIPVTFTGTGDDVVALKGGTPDLMIVDASSASGNFVIWSYGNQRDLLVNEIAPYNGTVIIPNDTFMLVIKAEGNWSIDVKTK
jgi:hypothetical protein